MQAKTKLIYPHKKRLVSIIVSSTIGFVVALIIILYVLQRIYYKNWTQNVIFSQACPNWWEINFFKKMNIFQIIFIVMISISAAIFLILVCISLYYLFHTQKWIKSNLTIHTFYVISISLGLLATLVVFLYALKLLINSLSFKDLYDRNLINSSCMSTDSYAFLEDKVSVFGALLGLTSVIFMNYMVDAAILPARMIGKQYKYAIRRKDRLNIGNQISTNQLLGLKPKIEEEIAQPIETRGNKVLAQKDPSNFLIDKTGQMKYYRNQEIQVDQNLGLGVPQPKKTKKEEIGTSTDNPKMKNWKVQVDIEIQNKNFFKNIENQAEFGVWTGQDDEFLYRSFGVGQGEAQRLETEYKSCGIGDQDIWRGQNHDEQRIKNLRFTKTEAEYIQFNSQSATTRNDNQPLVARYRNPLKAQSESTYFRKTNPTHVQFNDKGSHHLSSKEESEVELILTNRSSKNHYKTRSRIEQKSEQDYDGTIIYYNEQEPSSSKNTGRKHKELQSNKKQQWINKLRDKFKQKKRPASQLDQANKVNIEYQQQLQINSAVQSSSRIQKLRSYELIFQQDQRKQEEVLTQKNQIIKQYKQKTSHTPHKSKLKEKGSIPLHIKKELEETSKQIYQCNIFQKNEWC